MFLLQLSLIILHELNEITASWYLFKNKLIIYDR